MRSEPSIPVIGINHATNLVKFLYLFHLQVVTGVPYNEHLSKLPTL